jgi:hypothetical protein
MPQPGPTIVSRLLAVMAALLILDVCLRVLIGYRSYFPPDFQSDFLFGRGDYFWGAYAGAFYVHIVSGPVALLLGLILVNDRFRRTFSAWHRRLGKAQTVNVLLLVAPSGLWMAYFAATGAIAAAGLGSLAFATAASAALGWRSAVNRDFASHRRWMWRTFILLCSAVVIRLIGGLATVARFDATWLYPLSTWLSWTMPLLVLEARWLVRAPIKPLASARDEFSASLTTDRLPDPPAPSVRLFRA